MTALMEPRTFIQRELPSRCSRINFQALRTRVRTNSSALCQNTSHCLTYSISTWTAGSALWGKPMVITRRPAGRTASAARNTPMRAAPNLEHCQMSALWRLEAFFSMTTNDSESLASFRGLAQGFRHHVDSTSCASSRVDSQVAGHPCNGSLAPAALFEVGFRS